MNRILKYMKKTKKDHSDSSETRFLPEYVRFFPDHFVMGDKFYRIISIRGYISETEDCMLLSDIIAISGVHIRLKSEKIDGTEEKKIIEKSSRNAFFMKRSGSLKDSIEAENSIESIRNMISDTSKRKDGYLRTVIYIGIIGKDKEEIDLLTEKVIMLLEKNHLSADRLLFRQKDAFQSFVPHSFSPIGEYGKVFPSLSVAALYPLSFSSFDDEKGIRIGKGENGEDIYFDISKKDEKRTNSNILILGNSGEGKSYLMKSLVISALEAGKNVMILDPENEYSGMVKNLGGEIIDFENEIPINPLEPAIEDGAIMLTSHLSYLRCFFETLSPAIAPYSDILSIYLSKTYSSFGIYDGDMPKKSEDYPLLRDVYDCIKKDYVEFSPGSKKLLESETLRKLLLALYPYATGSFSKYFCSYTFFGTGRLLSVCPKVFAGGDDNISSALLFIIFVYMTGKLLRDGNGGIFIDEMHMFLKNKGTAESVRDLMKRVRKKESFMALASQNTDDFLLPEIREYTKPLFEIPSNKFLFNPGHTGGGEYMDILSLSPVEWEYIRRAKRGEALFISGTDKNYIRIEVPEYKTVLF